MLISKGRKTMEDAGPKEKKDAAPKRKGVLSQGSAFKKGDVWKKRGRLLSRKEGITGKFSSKGGGEPPGSHIEKGKGKLHLGV